MKNYTVNLTNTFSMPDIDYINELAVEKGFSLSSNFKTCPKVLEDLYYIFKKEHEDPDSFDVKNLLFSRKYIEDNILHRPLNPNEDAYYESTIIFLEAMDYSAIIGFSPMDKALRTIMYLTYLSSATNPENQFNSYSNGAMDPSKKNITIQDEQALAQAIKEQAENAMASVEEGESGGQRRREEKDGLSKEMTSCIRDHLYDLTPSIANVYGEKRPVDVKINRNILKTIQVKAYLEETQGLSTALEVKDKRSNASVNRKNLNMEEYSQITKVKKSAMMQENFDDKLVKKELIVKEKIKPEEKKQILYMLLDDSGSMSNVEKQTYVRAVLLNRLESVIDGKGELHFSYYESEKYGYFSATDEKSAQKLYRDVSLRRPRGGGTHIGNVLQQTVNEIKEKQTTKFHDPEILIVCDGDDYIHEEQLDPKDVTINVILLGRENDGLKAVANKTGGFYTAENLYNR